MTTTQLKPSGSDTALRQTFRPQTLSNSTGLGDTKCPQEARRGPQATYKATRKA